MRWKAAPSLGMDRALSIQRATSAARPLTQIDRSFLSFSVDARSGALGDANPRYLDRTVAVLPRRENTGEPAGSCVLSGCLKDDPRLQLLTGSGVLEPRAERPARRPTTRIVV